MPNSLDVSLNRLESSDLVRALPDADPAYLFKHALVQDTALSSLLNQERRRLHRLVAESLETVYTDRPDEIAVRLYQHYDAAGERDKTIEYAERAGDSASRKSAYAEAIIAYTRALALTEQTTGAPERRIRLMTRLGRTYEEDFKYDEALELYRRTREAAHASENRPLELAALVQIAKVYAVAAMRYNPEQSAQAAQEALELAAALGDQRAEAQLYWAMMLANVYGGRGSRQGLLYGEKSLDLARALDWREQMAFTLNDLSYTYLNLGETEQALATAAEARALWRELDNKPMLTDNLNMGAMLHVTCGELQAGLALAFESRGLAITIGNRWGESTSYMVDGYAEKEFGDFDGAIRAFQSCLDTGDPIGVQGPIVMARFELARIYAFLGGAERGMFFARDALERILYHRIDWDAWAFAVLAFVAEQSGDWKTADDTVRKIKDAPPEFYFERMLPFGAAETIHAQIRYARRQGDMRAARERADLLLERVRRSRFDVLIPGALDRLARTFIAEQEFDEAQTALDEGKALAQTLGLLPVRIALAQTGIELETARNNLAARDAGVRELAAHVRTLMKTVPPKMLQAFQTTALGKLIDE